MLCPMKFASNYQGDECEEENCEWWNSFNKSCAVWVLADYTRHLRDKEEE